jgi:hypothetical protein
MGWVMRGRGWWSRVCRGRVAGEIWRRVAEGATLFARLKIERDHDNLEYDIFGVPDFQVSAF